jgi:hypothetical protein
MDPNSALRELRVALSILLPRRARLITLAPDAYKRDELDDLIDAAAALDAWLSKGGWLPDAWRPLDSADPEPKLWDQCAGRTLRHEPDPFPSSPNLDDEATP